MEYVAIASAVMGALGAVSNAQAQSQSAQSQAAAADYNAQVSKQQSDNALAVANVNEEAQRRKNAAALGAQRAGLAEAGIGLDSGTGADLVAQSNANTTLDALNIRYEGQLRSNSFLNQAGLDTYSGQVARDNASRAQTAGMLGAGASILTGVGGYNTATQTARLNSARMAGLNIAT